MRKPTLPLTLPPLPNVVSHDPWLIVGQVGRVYGLRGWLKIYSYTDPLTNLIHYRPWHLQTPQGLQAISVTACRQHSKTLIAHFEGTDTPEAAQKWVNAKIAILRHQLPSLAPDEYYWADLPGLAVYNLQQQFLGHVERLFETGANDVLVVTQPHQPEILIPFVIPHVIKHVDIAQKRMDVDWEIPLIETMDNDG